MVPSSPSNVHSCTDVPSETRTVPFLHRRIEDFDARLRAIVERFESLSASLGDYLGRVRRHTDLPLAVGFGISTPEHVAEVGKVADGAIVASAMINYTDGFPLKEQPERAARFVRYLKGDVAQG